MASHRILSVIAASGALLAACGQADSKTAEPAAEAAPGSPAAPVAPVIAPQARSSHFPGFPHVPAEWDRNPGLTTGGGGGLEMFGAYIKQNPQILDAPRMRRAIADLYSCEEGERARANEVERAGIEDRAVSRYREFLSNAPSTFTVTVRPKLGEWSEADGAFGWSDQYGQSTMQPIPVTRIPMDAEALRFGCGSDFGRGVWAPSIYAHYLVLRPLRMSRQEASALLDRLEGNRYVSVEVTFDLASSRGFDASVGTAHRRPLRGELPISNAVPFEAYFRSAIVKAHDGREIARF